MLVASTVGCFRGGFCISRRPPSKWLLARVFLTLEAQLAYQYRRLPGSREAYRCMVINSL